jgi:hypothetical protein
MAPGATGKLSEMADGGSLGSAGIANIGELASRLTDHGYYESSAKLAKERTLRPFRTNGG